MICEEETMTIDVRNQRDTQLDQATVDGAERELAAFAAAIREMFGVAQVEQGIEDWMQELESMNTPSANCQDWRQVSIAAAARLAHRVCLLR